MFNLIVMGVALLMFIITAGLTWNNLSYIDKKKRTVTFAVLIGIVYIITIILFKVAIFGLNFGENKEWLESSEQMLILVVTPINSLLFIPYISSIIGKWKNKVIEKKQIQTRAIILSIILLIVLIVEGMYIRKLQVNIYEQVNQLLQQENKTH